MATAVLDASVVLAALQEEPGADIAAALLPTSLLLSVNLAEVVTKLARDGYDRPEIEAVVGGLDCEVVPFDRALAVDAGWLPPTVGRRSLSLGDRSCLALGLARALPVYTAERAWSELTLPVEIRLIR